MTTPLIFLDTETLGLGLDNPIWEIALIRREPDGAEVEHHFFVQHDPAEGDPDLPDSFKADYAERYDPNTAWDRSKLRPILRHLLHDRPTIVGAVPNFDTERIAHQLRVTGWHHRLRCVETLTAGHLGHDPGGLTSCAQALGIPTDEAHTALGDVRMVRAVWDRIMTRADL